VNHLSLVLAMAVPRDVPPPVFLATGIFCAALGLMYLYVWCVAAKKAAQPQPPEHLSPAQQLVRDKFEAKVDPRRYKVGGFMCLFMGAFFIVLYFVVSQA
jgi:hypothetical protein